jgi:hypothetical protein
MSFLPTNDRQYLQDKGFVFNEIVEGSQKGVVIQKYQLPKGKFDVPVVDLLILLRSGYPDLAPDMFHLFPWVKLLKAQKYPNGADQPVQFNGKKWQRWSRHNKDWRRGVDGIWTMLKRVEKALEVA